MEENESRLDSPEQRPSTESDPRRPPDPSTGAASGTAQEHIPKNVPASRGPKKRTKTGCLTCRKRRIKCGEEKPICNNCTKSKRECEGYAQRVIFKHPLGTLGAFQTVPLPSQLQQPSMRVPLFSGYSGPFPQSQPSGSQHPLLAPRPLDLSTAGASGYSTLGMPQSSDSEVPNATPFYYPGTAAAAEMRPFPQPHNLIAAQVLPSNAVVTATVAPNDIYQGSWAPASGQRSYHALLDQPSLHQLSGGLQAFPTTQGAPSHQLHDAHSLDTIDWRTIIGSQTDVPQIAQTVNSSEQRGGHYLREWPLETRNPPFSQTMSPSSGYNDESDDHYDVDSDEEMTEQTQHESFNQLNLIVASASQDERQLRSFTTHLNEPNILASYRPSIGSSPLNNPKTARIFVHFMHSTGPSMSIWERHPTNSSIMLGVPIPPAQQGLWTYTLPLKALEHPALLQAILAISSLHIAKLQQAPPTVSLKHYHYALKRVGVAVGLPLRRKQIATLAATLLLGFYEVMAAEHSKWNSHVAGSAQLIREIDFAGSTRDLRAHRRRIRAQRDQMAQSGLWPWYDQLGGGISEDDPFAEKESDLDERLIGTLMGRAINYDEFGTVEDEGQHTGPKKYFTKKDIEDYRIQSDLYWWYSKQDLFQSMISGNRLFTPYDQWGRCPPRAGIGKLDAIYGSMDHLILLLARLTDFGYRDRKRKLKALEATEGEWRPSQEFFKFMARFGARDRPSQGGPGGPAPPAAAVAGRPPSGFPGKGPHVSNPPNLAERQRHPQGKSQQSPPMYGMVPPRGPVCLPSAFEDKGCVLGAIADAAEETDLETATFNDADAEWESISAAFEVFSSSFGPEYGPLSPDIAAPISTPFGPALQYRTHTIAVLWGYYYVGRILLHRLHPSMPPATMVAAGVAAPTTAEFSQIIGKIMAGIYHPQRYNLEAGSLNPTLGAALTEFTVPIFFAGVQYTDAAQRGWTVSKLREISRLTGWQTSSAIAGGCESAWVAAARQGRGPPYEYTTNRDTGDLRGSGHSVAPEAAEGKVQSDVNTDRRFVTVSRSARVHWALGLLGLEHDVLSLELEDRMR